jgi:hypothetical protein
MRVNLLIAAALGAGTRRLQRGVVAAGVGDLPQSAIERIELGLSDGLVVALLSRFGSSLADATVRLARIQEAGGRSSRSMSSSISTPTSAGR